MTTVASPQRMLQFALFLILAAAGATLAYGTDSGEDRFQGHIMAPANASLPENASATVAFVRVSDDYSDPTTIAETDLGSVSGQGADYDLSVDGSKLDDGNQYALRARVENGEGDVVMTNGDIWPVEPASGAVTAHLQLRQSDGDA